MTTVQRTTGTPLRTGRMQELEICIALALEPISSSYSTFVEQAKEKSCNNLFRTTYKFSKREEVQMLYFQLGRLSSPWLCFIF